VIRIEHSYDDAMETMIRQAFAGDQPGVTLDGVAARARQNRIVRRRRNGTLAGAAVAVSVALVVTVASGPGQFNPPPRLSGTPTAASFAYGDPSEIAVLNDQCRQRADRLIGADAGVRLAPAEDAGPYPVSQQVSPVDGVGWFYRFTQPELGVFCAGTTRGQPPELRLAHLPPPAGPRPYEAMSFVTGQVGRWSYVLGRVPAGAVSVEVQLSDGRSLPATVGPTQDRIFTAWWPTEPGSVATGATAVVQRSDTRSLVTSDGSGEPTVAADHLDQRCRQQDPGLPQLWAAAVAERVRVYVGFRAEQVTLCLGGKGGEPSLVSTDLSEVVPTDGFRLVTGVAAGAAGDGANIAFAVGEAPPSGDVLVELDGHQLRTWTGRDEPYGLFAVWMRTDRDEAHLGRVVVASGDGEVWIYQDGAVVHQVGTQLSTVGRDGLAQARRLWAETEPAAYRYRLFVGCEFCPEAGEYRIEVENGRIRSTVRLPAAGGEGLPVPPNLPTLTELLTRIAQDPSAQPEFDTRYGYPTSVTGFGYLTTYAVTRFAPLTG